MGLAVFGVIMIRPLLQYDSRRADSADFDASEATRIVQIIETDPTTCQRFASRGTGRALPAIFQAVSGAGGAVSETNLRSPNLETLFLLLTGKELRE